jgi:hypothetical protein
MFARGSRLLRRNGKAFTASACVRSNSPSTLFIDASAFDSISIAPGSSQIRLVRSFLETTDGRHFGSELEVMIVNLCRRSPLVLF